MPEHDIDTAPIYLESKTGPDGSSQDGRAPQRVYLCRTCGSLVIDVSQHVSFFNQVKMATVIKTPGMIEREMAAQEPEAPEGTEVADQVPEELAAQAKRYVGQSVSVENHGSPIYAGTVTKAEVVTAKYSDEDRQTILLSVRDEIGAGHTVTLDAPGIAVRLI